MTDERRRNMTMIYGSLAYDLDTLARERQLEEAGEMPERSSAPQPKAQPHRHPQAQAKTRPSPLLVGGIVLVCALVMVLLLGYVQLTVVSNHVVTIKAAAEEAGMSKPTSGQVQYIDLSGSDTAVVYGDEPGVVEKAISSIKVGAQFIWEYFR